MMTQQNNTTSWVLHDPNGQPQMVKFVQADGKAISGIVTSGQTIKILKSNQSDQDGSQVMTTSGSSMLKLGNTAKIITKTLPVSTTFKYARTPEGPYIQKTIRIAPQQMQNLKLVTSTPQKIHTIQSQTSPAMPQAIIQQSPKNYISPPILDHSGARKRQDVIDPEYAPEYKRRKTEKVGKGLRHFSMKVCEKVRKKGTTSYNEVADELVGEFTNSLNSSLTDQQYDQKNIRRRVYDALNVLMAMNIISKEKKEIRWLGLPTNSLQECVQLEKEKQKRIQSIKEKTKKLQDLILNQVAFKNLAARNKKAEIEQGPPTPNSYIELPFVVIHTNKKTVVDCSISNDKMEYLFHFSDKFQVQDDFSVLKEVGMLMGLDKGECSAEDLEKIKSLVPKALEDYVIQLANSSGDEVEEMINSAGAGPSHSSLLNVDELVETQLDEDNSLQSSTYDPLSPTNQDLTDEEGESDLSSDLEIN